ncbi:MAG: heterodisulfide reductase-related iron-sulfur binding cluster [Candidatus Methanomethyliaceae archaeon]|nr:heterodisulfide reductase-related iron-sulfur binding cluster [Candidatus Methanomethyliaceae archaeon]
MPQKVLYWKGCMSRFRTKTIADSIERLLTLLNVDYTTLGEKEGCCGSVLYRTGQTADALSVSKNTLEKISSLNIKDVVTGCPGCFRTMSQDYTNAFRSVPFKVRHISQFLFDMQGELRGHLRPIEAKVVYHDPCHLGRHMGVYEEPRALIKMIPKVDLLEFKYNRNKALCCGSGGGVRSAFPEISLEISKSTLGELPEGTDILVTACPFCKYNFVEGNNRKIKIEIVDLPELILRACGG